MNNSELNEPLGDDVGTVAINFNDVMQEYLDSSDPDLNIPLSRIFQWFFDKGQEAMKEKAAKVVEGFDTCMCCSEYEIAAAIRNIA